MEEGCAGEAFTVVVNFWNFYTATATIGRVHRDLESGRYWYMAAHIFTEQEEEEHGERLRHHPCRLPVTFRRKEDAAGEIGIVRGDPITDKNWFVVVDEDELAEKKYQIWMSNIVER